MPYKWPDISCILQFSFRLLYLFSTFTQHNMVKLKLMHMLLNKLLLGNLLLLLQYVSDLLLNIDK